MENIGLERIIKMLEIAHTDDRVFPATELYSEGWMLRILLSVQWEGTECLPFPVWPRSRWFSEARIGSPFLARNREDSKPEGFTHVDGVIGHFGIRPGTKTGLILTADAKQLVVMEAKMSSLLSPNITHAEYHDQAARIVACIAWTISQSNMSVDDLESLGFYVFAPQKRIGKGVFEAQIDKTSIAENVERRINDYSGHDEEKRNELQTWYSGFFKRTLEHVDLRPVSWEDMIAKIPDPSVHNFYERCLEFNERNCSQPKKRRRNGGGRQSERHA